MATSAENLKMLMEYFGITNIQLSRTLHVDPSLVCRWLNGERKLRASSLHMDALTEYVLQRSLRTDDAAWLNRQFAAAGLPTDVSTVYQTKQNLMIWLASDGEALCRNMSGGGPLLNGRKADGNSEIVIDCADVALGLAPFFEQTISGTRVEVFLSNDQIRTITDELVSGLLLHMIEKRDLYIRMVVCVSGNTKAISRLIDTYMQPIISGHVQLFVIHGITQTVTHQMHVIFPGMSVALITELPNAAASPVASFVTDKVFVDAACGSFEENACYALPVLNIYGDDFSRNILEILYMEFCTPGALDVVKDNINPLYMEAEAYNHSLRIQGHGEAEYAWRSAEFARFKSGVDKTLKEGTVFREILSLARLNRIVRDGFCRMPGLYFMKKGFVRLDTEGCAAILNGYIRYLRSVPDFHVLILDDITMLHSDNCWQLKQNHHLAINHWHGTEPVMIHSDQLLLLREFQAHFDEMWARGEGSIGNKNNVIAVLQDVVKRLTEQHLMK